MTSFDLNDPRLAAEITRLVDARIAYTVGEILPAIRYGIVDSVDAANRKVAVRVGANPVAAPGFVYPAAYMAPVVGDVVRVVQRGADRYVDAVLTGDRRFPNGATRYVPLVPRYTALNINAPNNSPVAYTLLELTGVPTDVLAVQGDFRANPTTIVPTTASLFQLFDYSPTADYECARIALQGRPVGVTQGGSFIANTGGTGNRTIAYRTNQTSGGGVINLVIAIGGYWLAA